MIKYFFAFLLFVHGAIHLIGFSKAFGIGKITQLTRNISRTGGLIWLSTSLLFFTAAITYLLNISIYWVFGGTALVISQILIIANWHDAKAGSISNLIILPGLLIGFFSWQFKGQYFDAVNSNLPITLSESITVTEENIKSVPPVVQKYIRYCNVLNKPAVRNFKLTFTGEMRGKDKKWFRFKSEQYNFIDEPTRLFFMTAMINKLPFAVFHKYALAEAKMIIKLIWIFTIADNRGKEMNQAETVTYFNDICLFSPGSLVDSRIKWSYADEHKAVAIFTNHGINITATLYFNEQGQLVNFISDDRYDISGVRPEKFRFSTPAGMYKNINGVNVITFGETIWHYPEGPFVYGKFHLESIEYNLKAE